MRSPMFARAALALLVLGGVARAQAPDGSAPSDGGMALDGGARDADGASRSAHAGSPIARALDDFDFGDYEAVVARLRPIVDNGARELREKADRLEALRVYGIACTLTDRKTAAEGAFLLLLREEPSTRLDAALVRPEAVAFFDEVRARHREELLAAYRKNRPRYYWVLDLIPLAGQFQNRQWKKGVGFGAAELALLGGSIITYGLLTSWEQSDHTFVAKDPTGTMVLHDYRHDRDVVRPINITCFTALLGVAVAGIVDAFIVGARRQRRERQIESHLGY